MDALTELIDVFLHLDAHIDVWSAALGGWLYLVLFLIVFCETGLVVTPFLPGDSLLFAVGALTARPDSPLRLPVLFLLLIAAAVLGDGVNYAIGRNVGPRVFHSAESRIFNKKHLIRTQHFYEKYGGKTIVLARFMPIVRTFAPFVAGIGRMQYTRFSIFNVTGAVAWVGSFLGAGYYFGGLPMVKKNFHYVILGIIIVSILPGVIEYWRSRREAAAGRTAPPA